MTDAGAGVGGSPSLVGLDVSDPPGRWAALGFAVGEDGILRVGGVELTLGVAPPGRGIVRWTLGGTGAGLVPGLVTRVATGAARRVDAARPMQPNGVVGIDHVVVTVPALDALEEHGPVFRRRAEIRGRRMGFRRLGGPILEVVEDRDAPTPAFWGVTFALGAPGQLDELSRTNRLLGPARPAVQPGRRIATASGEAGLSTRVAFIDPALE